MDSATSTASKVEPGRIENEALTVYRYHPDAGPEIVQHLWRHMEPYGLRAVFHRERNRTFQEFLAYCVNLDNVLLVGVHRPTGEIVGAIWFHDVQPDWLAFASIWVERRWYGTEIPQQFGALVREWIWAVSTLRYIWAATRTRMGRRYAQSIGFVERAVLPQFCRGSRGPEDLHLLRLERS